MHPFHRPLSSQNLALILVALLLPACSSLIEKSQPSTKQISQRHLQCLAEAIHGEARGETEEGKLFVGRVILTRVEKGYGKNYCEVVYSKRQFAPKKKPTARSIAAAKKSLKLGPNGITHFHSYPEKSTALAGFSTTPKCQFKMKVGGHWGFVCDDYNNRRKTASVEDED